MKYVAISEPVARLAVTFLREYAEHLGNKSCNDYELPDWAPKQDLLTVFASRNPHYADEDLCFALQYDFSVVNTVAAMIEQSEER